MKHLLTLFFICLYSYTVTAQKKITYGVGLDIFQTQLNNVDRENFSGRGHSVPGFTQNDRLGFGASFLINRRINKKLSFETGLGISNFRSQFNFNYIDTFVGITIPIDRKLNISLYYLQLPLFVTYNLPLSPSSSIHTSVGINTKFLFAYYDNFEKIIVEFIQPPIARYNFFVPSLGGRIGYTYQLRTGTSICLELFGGRDFKKTVGENRGWWGFYENLATASYLYYGLSLKYYFTQ